VHAVSRRAGLDSPKADQLSTRITIIKVPARQFLRRVFANYPSRTSCRCVRE
jgi:hypothetical protein